MRNDGNHLNLPLRGLRRDLVLFYNVALDRHRDEIARMIAFVQATRAFTLDTDDGNGVVLKPDGQPAEGAVSSIQFTVFPKAAESVPVDIHLTALPNPGTKRRRAHFYTVSVLVGFDGTLWETPG